MTSCRWVLVVLMTLALAGGLHAKPSPDHVLSVLGGFAYTLPPHGLDAVRALKCALDLNMDVPEGFDPAAKGYRFTRAQEVLHGLKDAGIPLILGWPAGQPQLNLADAPPVRDEAGQDHTYPHDILNPEARRAGALLGASAVTAAVQSEAPIAGFYLPLCSNYGEIEFPVVDWFRPRFTGYGEPAVRYFRERSGAVSDPPKPDRADGPTRLDTRPDWLHWSVWRTHEISGYMRELLDAVRPVSRAAMGVKVSPYYQEAAAGPSVGHMLKTLAAGGLDKVDCTDGHSIAAQRYLDTVRRYYGIARMVPENDGYRYTAAETRKVLINSLLGGCDAYNYCQLSALNAVAYGQPGIPSVGGMPALAVMPNDAYRLLVEARTLFESLNAPRPRTSVVFLHAAYAGHCRAPLYRNRDVHAVYDTVLTGAHALADWAAPLGYPDILDDTLIDDGALDGIRMVILPNSSFTVLRDSARQRLVQWVKDGGTLVLTGAQALRWSLTDTGLRDYGAAPLAGLVSAPPARSASALSLRHQKEGKGHIFYTDSPVPEIDPWSGACELSDADRRFWTITMPQALERVARNLRTPDLLITRGIKAAWRGVNHTDNRHLVVAAILAPDREEATLELPEAITGPVTLWVMNRHQIQASIRRVTPRVTATPEGALWRDPTNMAAAGHTVQMPITRIEWEVTRPEHRQVTIRWR